MSANEQFPHDKKTLISETKHNLNISHNHAAYSNTVTTQNERHAAEKLQLTGM
jgi:hypothetical protein